ncbi:uncharacterized protein [Bemisia tabaci]|uniref:uncharacterized protein isoform X2 n=1 Tax=Bemisia tabaci TaxID=7038 RepID=UPI003B28BEEB
MIVNLNMILALLWSFPLVLTFIKATPTPGGKSFDELLDAFKVTETNRAAGIQRAIKLAEDRNQNMTVKFLGIVGEANEILVKIREFFDAGRVLLNYKRGTATIPESEITAKTQLLHRHNYLNDQLDRLAAIHKTMDSQMREVSQAELIVVASVINSLEQSEQELHPLMKTFNAVVEELQQEITPASAPAPTPTSNQQNKRFDKLLNIFKSVETNRKTTMKEAKEAVSNHKNYDTEKFLGIVGETDEILVNLRRFFDAGKVMFDAYKRRLTSGEQDEEAWVKGRTSPHSCVTRAVQC